MSKVARIPVPQKKKERQEFEVMIGNSGVEKFEADTKAGAYKQAVKKHCKEGDVSFMKMTEAVITKEVLPLFKEAIEDDKDGTMGEIATTLAYFFLNSGDPDVVDGIDEEAIEDLADNFSGAGSLSIEEGAEKLFKKNKAKGVAKFKKNLLTLCRSGVFYLRFMNEPQVLFCNKEEVFEGVYDLFGTQTTSWNSSASVEELKEANGKLIPFLTYDRKKIASDPEYKEKFLNIMLPTAYSSRFSNTAEAKEYYDKFNKPREEDTEDEDDDDDGIDEDKLEKFQFEGKDYFLYPPTKAVLRKDRDGDYTEVGFLDEKDGKKFIASRKDGSPIKVRTSDVLIKRLDKAIEENKLERVGDFTSQMIHNQLGYDKERSGAFSQRNTTGYDEVYLLEDKYGAEGRKADELFYKNLGALSILTDFKDENADDTTDEITEGSIEVLKNAGDLGFILQDAFEKIASLEEELQGRDTDKETDVDNSDFQEQGKEVYDFYWDSRKPSFPKDLDFLDDDEKNAVYNVSQYIAILKDTSDQEALVLAGQIFDDGIFPLVEEIYRLGQTKQTVEEEEEEEKSEFADVSRLLKEIAELTEAREKDRKEIRKIAALERQLDDVRDEADDFARNALELEEKVKELEAQKAAVEEDDDEEKIDRSDDFDALYTILEQMGVDVDEVLEEVKDADGISEFLQSEKYRELIEEPIERSLF